MADLVIRQFDVFLHPTAALSQRTPFLIVLQSHYVNGLETKVVAPLHAAALNEKLPGLSVEMTINGIDVVLVVSELAHLPGGRLRQRVGSLLAHEDDMRRALDRLFTGF